LDVTLDWNLKFDQHVSDVCSSANFHLRAIRHIRSRIDKDTASTIVCSLIGSKLDYCNAVLAGISDYNIMRLQRVQNSAAKIVYNVKGRCSASALLRELHWLPVAQRIDYKIGLMSFKILANHQPSYLTPLLIQHHPPRQLLSSYLVSHAIFLSLKLKLLLGLFLSMHPSCGIAFLSYCVIP